MQKPCGDIGQGWNSSAFSDFCFHFRLFIKISDLGKLTFVAAGESFHYYMSGESHTFHVNGGKDGQVPKKDWFKVHKSFWQVLICAKFNVAVIAHVTREPFATSFFVVRSRTFYYKRIFSYNWTSYQKPIKMVVDEKMYYQGQKLVDKTIPKWFFFFGGGCSNFFPP